MIQVLLKLPRKSKQALMLLFDFIAIIFSLLAAFSIHFGYLYFPLEQNDLLFIIIISPLLALPIFISFGLYSMVIRYVGFKELWRILQAITMYSFLWGLITFMADVEGTLRSLFIIYLLVLILFIIRPRFFARWLLSEININNKVLIYGSGSAGRQLSSALKESKEYKPVAFIDDSNEMYLKSINGLKVFSRNDIDDLIKKENINEVFIAIPSLSRAQRNEIIKSLEQYPISVRSLPGMLDLVQGGFKVEDLLEINLLDLLGREAVKTNIDFLKINVSKKVVLVTGAGGSIGSELCRQIISLKPDKLVLYEISEPSLYQIEHELLSIGLHNIVVVPVLGSVLDKERLKKICNHYEVKTIYHAAAYKHVPLVEANQSQGVLNNIIGTLRLAEAAISSNVETFVLISTDKAVRPTNIMGATKRVAELTLQALAKVQSNTCFTMVRFGNVLDSSGSVIPLFKNQIKKGGPITVTHSDIVRYFMTIPEAVSLVIHAGEMAEGGEVFLLDMGEPVRIYDLAVKMIQLSGLKVLDENNPKGDIEIQFTGLRPGEKLYEELLVSGKFIFTKNKMIMRAEEQMITWNKLEPMLVEIKEAAKNSDNEKIYNLLKTLIPEFNPSVENYGNNDLKSK